MCLTFFKSTLYPDLEIPNAPIRTNFTKFPLIHCIPLQYPEDTRWFDDRVMPSAPQICLSRDSREVSKYIASARNEGEVHRAAWPPSWRSSGHGMDMEWMNSSWIHYEFIMNWYCCGRSKTIRVHPPIMKCMKDCSWLFYMRVFRGVPIWWCLLIN